MTKLCPVDKYLRPKYIANKPEAKMRMQVSLFAGYKEKNIATMKIVTHN